MIWRRLSGSRRPTPEEPTPGDGQAVRFYRGECQDHQGRSLCDILAWDHARLARSHDYVQWLFPLAEPSDFNSDAPLLGPEDIAEFITDPSLRAALLRAFVLMLSFYGLELEDAAPGPRVVRGENFAGRAPVWLTPQSHQPRRITRILRSAFVLGLPGHARALFECLHAVATEYPYAIGQDSLAYWADAIDLQSAPR
jgi:hypothetical protein